MTHKYNKGEIIFHVHSGTPYKVLSYDSSKKHYILKSNIDPRGKTIEVSELFIAPYFEKISTKKYDNGGSVDKRKELHNNPEYIKTSALLNAMLLFSEISDTESEYHAIYKNTVSGVDKTDVSKMKLMAEQYRNFLIENSLYNDYLDFVSDNFPKDSEIPLFAKGGEVDYYEFDRKMALIYLDEIYNYALKLDKLISDETDLEDWVKMKLTRIEQSIADVNRSLKGWQKFASYGQGGVIVKSQLKHIADYSKELLEMVKSGAKLMSWQEAKIAIAGENIDSIFHRLDYSLQKTEYAEGGVIRRFDRHAEMSSETRSEILDLIKLPYDEKFYDKLKAKGLNFMEYENYLFGLYDGYDYSQTKPFNDTFAKVKSVSLPLYKRVMKVYETVNKYNFFKSE